MFWVMEPEGVKLLILGAVGVVSLSVVQSARLARRLYRLTRSGVSPESIGRPGADPDVLAAFALAGRVWGGAALGSRADIESSLRAADSERILSILRATNDKFLLVWERCHADLVLIKRSSVFVLLLSSIMVLYGACQTYNDFFNGSNRTGAYCIFLTVDEVFRTLALGLSCCAVLYLISSFLERTLADRRSSWNYFCSKLKNELSRE